MVFCPQCGAKNPETSRYCDQCGTALIAVPAAVSASSASVSTPVSAAGTCPQCGVSVLPGEAFCDSCGAPLSAPVPGAASNSGPAFPPPQVVYSAPTTPPPTAAPPVRSAPVTPPPSVVPQPATTGRSTLAPGRLSVSRSGAVLALPASAQAVLGRSDSVSGYVADLDLTASDAQGNGVGRQHARLLLLGGQVAVEDLNSTNGTFVNGTRLQPHQPRPLANGDTLRLGRLELVVGL